MCFVFYIFLLSVLLVFFFFFSSRRRHTRLQGDWSSDVCSSDLAGPAVGASPQHDSLVEGGSRGGEMDQHKRQIGRASCRERECICRTYSAANNMWSTLDGKSVYIIEYVCIVSWHTYVR